MSADYRRFEMGDPLNVLIARENATCKGCIYKKEVVVVGEKKEMCIKGKKLKRCKFYRELPVAPSTPSMPS